MDVLKNGIKNGITNLVDFTKGFFDKYTELLYKFWIPSTNPFDEVKELLEEKIPLLGKLTEMKDIILPSDIEEEKPSYTLQFNNYHGFTGGVQILDLDWYDPFRNGVRVFLSVLVWGATILKLFKKIPSALGGV